MSTFVKQADVEEEQFDWGTIGWRTRPANTGSKQLVVMDVTLEPGEGHAFHRHDGQEEVIIVKQGAVTQFIERDSTTLGPGDSVYLDAGVVHASYNDGDDDRSLAGRDRSVARRRWVRARRRFGRRALGVGALAARRREQFVGRYAPDRGVDDLDRMKGRQRPSRPSECRRDLHEAPWVSARVYLGTGLEDSLCLPVAQLLRCVGPHDVVDAGAAATELLLARLDELDPRNRCEDGSWLRFDPLSVLQVARVLERDAERERLALRRSRRLGEKLRDVDDVRVEVILQMRAAACRVRDDRGVAAQVALQLPRTGYRPRPSGPRAHVARRSTLAAMGRTRRSRRLRARAPSRG